MVTSKQKQLGLENLLNKASFLAGMIVSAYENEQQLKGTTISGARHNCASCYTEAKELLEAIQDVKNAL